MMKFSFPVNGLILICTFIFVSFTISCKKNRDNVDPKLSEVITGGNCKMNDTIRLYFVNMGIRENAKVSVAPKHARESRFVGISDPNKAYYEYVPETNFIGRDTMEITGTDNRENRRVIAFITLQVY